MSIKVLIIDDSALVRSLLKEIINNQPDMEVVGTATDPIIARELIKKLNPDVLTLDIEMPRMDGISFLEKLMRLRPTPVIMISTLTEKNSETTFRALELGAVDFVTKPVDVHNNIDHYSQEISDKIRAAFKARPKIVKDFTPPPYQPQILNIEKALSADVVLAAEAIKQIGTTEKIVVIGASTGGTEAIKEVLMSLPADMPGIVIAQHMPPGFTKSFSQRLDSLCKIRVIEAQGGEKVTQGCAYIAPGHAHMVLKRNGSHYTVELNDGPPVNRHKPSVDVLFRSAANFAGKNAVGVLLTGMGKDGAQGLLEMHQTGAHTIAQDESSCVVFGMPKEAILLGAADEVVSLRNIASRIIELTKK